jgi:hypothetical protein
VEQCQCQLKDKSEERTKKKHIKGLAGKVSLLPKFFWRGLNIWLAVDLRIRP